MFNKDRTIRHLLWRRWKPIPSPKLTFICLNPSKADEKKNDHSVTKMIGFSEAMGCGALDVVNLFDYISTDPSVLYVMSLKQLTSTKNDLIIVQSVRTSDRVICAWGNHGAELFGRGADIYALLYPWHHKMFALELNANGSPSHPLRLPYSSTPVKFKMKGTKRGNKKRS